MINTTPSVTLPEDVERAVEQAKNNLTVMQVETTRLTKFKSQLEKDVTDLTSVKSNLEAKVTELQSQSDKLTSDNATLQENVKTSNLTLENIKVEQSTIQSEITAQRASNDVETAKIKADREQLTQDQTVLNLDKELFAKEQEEHKVKKSFLQEILTKI